MLQLGTPQQLHRIIYSYNTFRLTLALLLLISLLLPRQADQPGSELPLLVLLLCYGLFSLGTALLHAMTSRPASATARALLLSVDLLLLSAVSHLLHDLVAGLHLLLLLPVALGGVLLPQRRQALLPAAIGSLGLLTANLYHIREGLAVAAELSQAGILGALLFATAILLHSLADYQRRTSALTRHRQQLQERHNKLAALGRLTASIAHEVRNPLAAISHAAQLLQESEGLKPEDRRLTDIVVNQSRRVGDIIQNILDLSRREVRSSENIQLNAWLQQFLEQYQALHAPTADISVRVEPPGLTVQFVPGQLAQVLGNLLDNALRYSLRHTGSASATVRAKALPGHQYYSAVLQVIDQGPGVAPEEYQHLFQPFHTTETDGVGLGLYLSRLLSESNGATLQYESGSGNGACFALYFAQNQEA